MCVILFFVFLNLTSEAVGVVFSNPVLNLLGTERTERKLNDRSTYNFRYVTISCMDSARLKWFKDFLEICVNISLWFIDLSVFYHLSSRTGVA